MKTTFSHGIAILAGVGLLSAAAWAQQQHYVCRAGAVTITSTSPCYVTTYGISVPGSDKVFGN